jgi:hypothetical protein
MECTGHSITIFADGVPIGSPRKDVGCKGEVRRFSVTTSLEGPLSYFWTLNGDIISTKPYYDYTYPTTNHHIGVQVNSNTSQCGLGQTFTAEGQACSNCPITCTTQTVKMPAGELKYLEDISGKRYPVTQDMITTCKQGSNLVQSKAVKRALKMGLKCNMPLLSTNIYFNQEGRNCLTLQVSNSPIKLKSIRVGNTDYLFDTSKC